MIVIAEGVETSDQLDQTHQPGMRVRARLLFRPSVGARMAQALLDAQQKQGISAELPSAEVPGLREVEVR